MWCFLPYINMNQPCMYMCFPSWPSLPPLSHPIPQGHPNAPALITLFHASNLDWWSISHMIIYMFQCYCLRTSHLHLLPQSPKVCSLHLCLFCYLTYRVTVTIFLKCITLLSLFLSFIFCPISFQRWWAAFLGVWCYLLAIRSCFVEFAQHSNVLLMNLQGRKWSPHSIPLPS